MSGISLSPKLGRSNIHPSGRLGPSKISLPSGFDPRSLGSLAAWYDARYPAGVGGAIPADGAALAQWNDLSGNGRHATQATGSQQPLFRSANPNLLTYNQATVETDTTGLAALNGNSTIARSTTDAAHGTASLQVTSVAAGLTGANTLTGTSGVPVAASTQYTALISAKAPTITANWTPIIYWWKANGTASATPSSSGTAAALTTSYAQLFVTATSPSDAAFATVGFSWTAVAASEVVRVDKLGWAAGSSTTWLPPVTLPNGLPTVQFDGVNDILAATVPSLSDSTGISTYFVVAEETTPFATSPRVFGIGGGSNFETFADFSSRRLYARAGSAISLLGPSVADTAFHTASQIVASGAQGGTLDGAQAFSGVTTGAVTTGTSLSVGGGAGTNGQWRLSALLIYSAAHTTTQRQAVERWLGRTWGVSVA